MGIEAAEPTVRLEFHSLKEGRAETLAILTLARPSTSNAFNGAMMQEIRSALAKVQSSADSCRGLLIKGKGKHFCAGADLEWMRSSARLSETENREEAAQLSEMFTALYRLPVPTVAYVHGACYGGAVGLVAACDWAVASDNARFCLSEVKVGVVAAVILPFVAQKIAPGHLRRLVLQARVFSAAEARDAGLVQRVTSIADAEAVVRDEMEQLVAGSPEAQRAFKKLHQQVVEGAFADWETREQHMVQTIARLRTSENGQKGLSAFFDKKAPDWVLSLPPNLRFFPPETT